MTEDTTLIGMVQRKATGASVHDVAGLIGYYRGSIECANHTGNRLTQEEKDHAAIGVQVATRIFHDFLTHGDINKARADNPLPKPPRREQL